MAARAALVSLLFGVTFSIAHTIDTVHAHEQCAFSVDGESFNITALQRQDQMWSVLDRAQSQSYYFNLCGDATQVDSTQCLGANNTKMSVFGCQITYGRPNAVNLGDSFSVERYKDGAIPSGKQPLTFPITNGVHVNISGGHPCHTNHKQRQLDIWIECDADSSDKGQPRVPPQGPVETDYCEYDLFWTSSYACRECTADDYTKSLLDPPVAQFDSTLGCRLDGNWTVRYQKKADSECAHGIHDGVMTTGDLNEYCDGQDCPHGFKKTHVYGDFYECVPCASGTTTDGRNSVTCTPCSDNQFAPNRGSDQCMECGHGTTANSDHTDCEFLAGHCAYIATDPVVPYKYDLSRMASDLKMAGPVVQDYHQYYVNLCSTGHAEHACFNASNEPLVSYSCQIPQGSTTAKDIGNTIGIWELSQPEKIQFPQGGVRVELTGGSVCHHQGAQHQRSTDIFVTCNMSAGVGQPVAPEASSWNPTGVIEPNDACKYELLWPSSYGCPVCVNSGATATYQKQESVCDPDTGLDTPKYDRMTECVEPNGQPGALLVTDYGAQTACNPACAKGSYTSSQGSKKICLPCPMGQTSQGGSDVQCTRCTGNTYNYDEGSSECFECGAGTSVNEYHNGCNGLSECQWNLNDELYDLKPLDKHNTESISDMFGPIVDQNSISKDPSKNFQYYVNLCSRQSNKGVTCAGDDGNAIESFACQRTTLVSATLGHLKGVNLGDTMGVSSTTPGAITVMLTHGTKCHRDPQPFRSTQIDLRCDESAGVGAPLPYKGQAEVGYCKYRFSWNTVQACPVCTAAHFSKIVSECEQGQDGNWMKQSHSRKISSCNPNAASAFKPADTAEECEAPGSTPWYKTAAFLITVIVLSSSILGAVAVFALVKYWKVRRLYETYAQLDKDRGIDDFAMPESLELDSRKEDGGL